MDFFRLSGGSFWKSSILQKFHRNSFQKFLWIYFKAIVNKTSEISPEITSKIPPKLSSEKPLLIPPDILLSFPLETRVKLFGNFFQYFQNTIYNLHQIFFFPGFLHSNLSYAASEIPPKFPLRIPPDISGTFLRENLSISSLNTFRKISWDSFEKCFTKFFFEILSMISPENHTFWILQ